MQEGSYLLDDMMEPCSADLDAFLAAADWSEGQDLQQLHWAMRKVKSSMCRHWLHARRYQRRLENRFEEAIDKRWTGFHQTNLLLHHIATYGVVWLKLSGQLIDYMVTTACSAWLCDLVPPPP